jgi:hypothetical protein
MEYLGILPVVTTAPNALYYQKLIENSNYNFKEYNALKYIKNVKTNDVVIKTDDENITIKYYIDKINNDTVKENKNIGFVYNLGSEDNTDFQ